MHISVRAGGWVCATLHKPGNRFRLYLVSADLRLHHSSGGCVLAFHCRISSSVPGDFLQGSWWTKWLWGRFSYEFVCSSPFHHCSILTYHWLLRCAITLTRQRIITFWVLKFGTSSLWLGTWLVRESGSFILAYWGPPLHPSIWHYFDVIPICSLHRSRKMDQSRLIMWVQIVQLPYKCPFHILLDLFSDTLSGSRSQDSTVGIVTGYRLDDWGVGVQVPVGSRIFCSSRCPDRLWAPHSLLYSGYRGVKRPGREADHSPLGAVNSKMEYAFFFFSCHVSWCDVSVICLCKASISVQIDAVALGLLATCLIHFAPHFMRCLLLPGSVQTGKEGPRECEHH
jgi:hypothetical protein